MLVCFKMKQCSLLVSDHVPPPTQTTYRGVKNPEAVERKRKKQEEIEKQAMTTSASGGGGLKVGTVTLLIVILPAKLERFLCPPLQWQVG